MAAEYTSKTTLSHLKATLAWVNLGLQKLSYANVTGSLSFGARDY